MGNWEKFEMTSTAKEDVLGNENQSEEFRGSCSCFYMGVMYANICEAGSIHHHKYQERPHIHTTRM